MKAERVMKGQGEVKRQTRQKSTIKTKVFGHMENKASSTGGVMQKQAGYDPPERKCQWHLTNKQITSHFHSSFLQKKIQNIQPDSCGTG